jgi:hypothetical protein
LEDPLVSGGGERVPRADLDRLVRRLRSFSQRSWTVDGRREALRQLLDALAEMTASGRRVPPLPDHALPDAVAVLGRDALAVPENEERVAQLLRDALDKTR